MNTTTTRNTDNATNDEATLAHIMTIGRDFDKYGGDIPYAIACVFYAEEHKPKGYNKLTTVCLSKIMSAEDAEKRLKPVSLACEALRESIGHEDWIVDALTAYYASMHSAEDDEADDEAERMAVNAIKEASIVFKNCKDEPMKLVKALTWMTWNILTGKFKEKALAA